jgi:hypothetical protein
VHERERAHLPGATSSELASVPANADTPVARFVRHMAVDIGLGDSPADRRTRRQLRRLSDWATSQGLPLDREMILDPDTIERFIEFGLAGNSSRATYRSVLRKVGPLLTTRAPWEPRAPSVARRQVARPYLPEEVELLRTDAFHQPTPARVRAARALLALGLGAGLDGRWVTRVAGSDVTWSRTSVFVRVGAPSTRKIVVRAEWEHELADLASTAGDEFLVGGKSTSARRTGHLTEAFVVPTGHPRLAPARLRSTWLLNHLIAGTRLPELCRHAGLQGVTVLSDLLPLVEPMSAVAARAMLRGEPQ